MAITSKRVNKTKFLELNLLSQMLPVALYEHSVLSSLLSIVALQRLLRTSNSYNEKDEKKIDLFNFQLSAPDSDISYCPERDFCYVFFYFSYLAPWNVML